MQYDRKNWLLEPLHLSVFPQGVTTSTCTLSSEQVCIRPHRPWCNPGRDPTSFPGLSWRHTDPSPNRWDPCPVDDEEQVVTGRCHVAVRWRHDVDRSRRGPGDHATHEPLGLVPAVSDGTGPDQHHLCDRGRVRRLNRERRTMCDRGRCGSYDRAGLREVAGKVAFVRSRVSTGGWIATHQYAAVSEQDVRGVVAADVFHVRTTQPARIWVLGVEDLGRPRRSRDSTRD